MITSPEPRKHSNVPDYVATARRPVTRIRAARLVGDDRAADRWARVVQRNVDRHLAELRERLP